MAARRLTNCSRSSALRWAAVLIEFSSLRTTAASPLGAGTPSPHSCSNAAHRSARSSSARSTSVAAVASLASSSSICSDSDRSCVRSASRDATTAASTVASRAAPMLLDRSASTADWPTARSRRRSRRMSESPTSAAPSAPSSASAAVTRASRSANEARSRSPLPRSSFWVDAEPSSCWRRRASSLPARCTRSARSSEATSP